jgi:hypothetical protein
MTDDTPPTESLKPTTGPTDIPADRIHMTIEGLEREADVAWNLVEYWKRRTLRWMYFTIGALALAAASFADLLLRNF